jgi:hypothetical protein
MEHAGDFHTGGCLCGAVRYRMTEAPLRSGIYHCRTCRKVGLAPTLPFVVFPSRTFAFEIGEPRELASSPGVVRSFCGSCGLPLTYVNAKGTEFIDIMPVSLDKPDAYPPLYHVWISQKIAWEFIADDLSAYAQGRE